METKTMKNNKRIPWNKGLKMTEEHRKNHNLTIMQKGDHTRMHVSTFKFRREVIPNV